MLFASSPKQISVVWVGGLGGLVGGLLDSALGATCRIPDKSHQVSETNCQSNLLNVFQDLSLSLSLSLSIVLMFVKICPFLAFYKHKKAVYFGQQREGHLNHTIFRPLNPVSKFWTFALTKFIKMGHCRPLLYMFIFSIQCSIKFPNTRFEPQTSGIVSGCSAN